MEDVLVTGGRVPQDLIRRAALNSVRHKTDARQAVVADSTGAVDRFAADMAKTVASTSVHAAKVRAFDLAGEILTKRMLTKAWLDQTHQPSDHTAVEAAFDAQDAEYYSWRTAFEDVWLHGRSFVYFALIIEGLGYAGINADDFGPYCLVMTDTFIQGAHTLGAFPRNTTHYAEGRDGLSITDCETEAASWADRAALVTWQRASEVPAWSHPGRWSDLICASADDVTEVVRDGPIGLREVHEIRIGKRLLDDSEDARLRRQLGQSLTYEESTRAELLDMLDTWKSLYNVAIVAV